MVRVGNVWMVVLLLYALMPWMGGCPADPDPSAGGDPTETETTTLTDAEDNAATAAAKAGGSIAQAIDVAKSPTETDDDQTSLDLPEISAGSQELTVGTCPEVALSISGASLLTFDMTIDFGSGGCNPGGVDDYTCTGSASGTFDQQGQTLAVSFESISCNDVSLTGDIDVTYDLDNPTIELDGDWDLTYEDEIGTILTDGAGTGSYNASTLVTDVSSFTGTVSDTVSSYTVTLSDIQVSYATYENLIPFAGEATVSGSGIRTLTIRFDTDSPTTGVVEVSIGGSPYVDVDLFAL